MGVAVATALYLAALIAAAIFLHQFAHHIIIDALIPPIKNGITKA